MNSQRSQHNISMSDQQINEINDWLIQQNVNILPCRWAREFSDAVLLAKILSLLFTRMVNLNQYPTCNKTELKLKNWELLNSKILTRLGVPQNKDELEKLSKGIAGAIETLLYKLITKLRKNELKKAKSRASMGRGGDETFDGSCEDFITVKILKEVNGDMVEVQKKMIAYTLYEEARREIKEKSARVDRLQEEVTRLTTLLASAQYAIKKARPPKSNEENNLL